ncbi:MAG: 16S rRNA (guanine(527)-N(7))-methyltransferase RsmG [Hyphomicrobiales bacterium]|nr:16S rRNA (guanine(527)-N(7))-methyltransferase RsmG [Hyphomicrobiales bacterium]
MSDSRLEDLQRVAGPVSRETFSGLQAFEGMFQTWAKSINLSSSSTIPDLWKRHVLDSAQLAPLAAGAIQWLDLGSGGGFPGLILAFLLKERPGASIDLVESNRKKAAFLATAIGQFALPARVHAVRIGSEIKGLRQPEVVTARALAPLPQLLELAWPWLSSGARGLLHKGRDYAHEIQESSLLWQYDLIEHRSRIDADSVVLEIADLKRK